MAIAKKTVRSKSPVRKSAAKKKTATPKASILLRGKRYKKTNCMLTKADAKKKATALRKSGKLVHSRKTVADKICLYVFTPGAIGRKKKTTTRKTTTTRRKKSSK